MLYLLLKFPVGLATFTIAVTLISVILGLLTALLGALFSGLLDHYFFNINFQHAVALFWLCLGLGVVSTLVPSGSEPPAPLPGELAPAPT